MTGVGTARIVPASLRGHQRSWLRTDILAGVTLAAVAIPETMGYTSIAQVPIVTGLYTVIFPTLVFALLASSRLLVVGADNPDVSPAVAAFAAWTADPDHTTNGAKPTTEASMQNPPANQVTR